jgi:CheY-like chemotaxis protein
MNFGDRVGQSPTRLLLVEDYSPLAEAIAELLRNAGLTVRIAESGQEALRAAIAFRPEIVLFDLSLPDMSGLDVARALRSNPDTKDALLAMHTAMSDIDIRTFQSKIPSDVVNLFLSKPLTEEKVASLLAGLAATYSAKCPGIVRQS